jgi:hypothetical protein
MFFYYCSLDCPDELSVRKPSLYFTPGGLRTVRIRLKRLTHDMNSFPSLDAFYEELLDCFIANGRERRVRSLRSSSAPAWVAFVPDEIQEVRRRDVYFALPSLLLFSFFICLFYLLSILFILSSLLLTP